MKIKGGWFLWAPVILLLLVYLYGVIPWACLYAEFIKHKYGIFGLLGIWGVVALFVVGTSADASDEFVEGMGIISSRLYY